MFLILLYPFNSTIAAKIYQNNFIILLTVVIPIIGLLMFGERKFSNRFILVLICTFILLFIILVNNHDFGSLGNILYIIYLFLPLAIMNNKYSIECFCTVIKIFICEHFILNLIAIFFKNFYKSTILSFVCSGRSYCAAAGNFYNGYIPGLTTHFSTNAIYMSIATIFLFSEYLTTKKKSSLLFSIASLLILFAIGKRLHLVATIICLVSLYFFNRNRTSSKNYAKKIIIILSTVIILFICVISLSKYFPEIMNVFNRMSNLIDEDDILNGRGTLAVMALNMWEQHLIFGNGWWSFSHNYRIFGQFGTTRTMHMDAHNVFIQLLCEVGLVGFAIIIFILLKLFIKSYKIFSQLEDTSLDKKISSKFCFGYFMFFLMYCFTGNPLYDPQCYVVLFIVIGIILFLDYRNGDKCEK